jgi:hypothetical protein
MRLHLDTFAGMIPAIHPSKLPVSHAADCSACFFDRGVLLPMREPSSVVVKNGLSDPVLGMHRTAGGTWQTYGVPISVVRSPIIDNEHYLLTGTGLAPRQFDQDEAEAIMDVLVYDKTALEQHVVAGYFLAKQTIYEEDDEEEIRMIDLPGEGADGLW